MDWSVVVVRMQAFRHRKYDPSMLLRDEQGFTTVGVALALLIVLSLIFTTGQVYRVNSASADVQNVADAAALAAENQVAEFMIVVRACDAVVLSLSLTGIAATGLGVAALCTPATAVASETLLKAGREIMQARDAFAKKAAAGLNRLQKAVPFLAAVSAAGVASANDGGQMGAAYLGFAVLVPAEGKDIVLDAVEGAHDLANDVEREAESIKQAAAVAENAAQEANVWKERAFQRDCGDAPSYCMSERATTLAGLSGSENPRYTSVDTWSFSVALDRARTYYAHRLAEEMPQGASVEEQARSVLRERFYAYASSEVARGYVHETANSFDALFPHLPKNTAHMRETTLYTDAVYPVSSEGGESVMHAWRGCPGALGASVQGSISQMEQGNFVTCSQCNFSAASMGKVAAASTSIENGFEYHYEAVAQAAEAYQKLRAELDPLAVEVKDKASSLFDRCLDVLRKVGGKRIDAAPPGRFGVVAFVVNTRAAPASTGFASGYVREAGPLGTRAAVSAATLVAEPSDEGKNVISSLLDGLKGESGAVTGVLGVVLDCWSGLLQAYVDGQQALEQAIGDAADALPLGSASGLGTWAASALGKAVGALGLQPVELDALKPAVVNSAHVSGAEDGSFSTRFLAVKARMIATPLSSSDLFSSVITSAETAALDSLATLDGTIEIASIRLWEEGGPSIPIVIVLPQVVKDATADFIGSLADSMRALYAQVVGVRTWE